MLGAFEQISSRNFNICIRLYISQKCPYSCLVTAFLESPTDKNVPHCSNLDSWCEYMQHPWLIYKDDCYENMKRIAWKTYVNQTAET